MKRLLLLRHAKATQDSSGDDHSRPLAPRGCRDAPAMGKAMRKRGWIPDLVLCSDAVRTRQTWDLLAPELGTDLVPEISEGLYLAEWPAIARLVRATPQDVSTLLVIGHNPGLEMFAAALLRPQANTREQRLRTALTEKFPTAGLAVLDCDIAEWHALVPKTAVLTNLLKPRDLEN